MPWAHNHGQGCRYRYEANFEHEVGYAHSPFFYTMSDKVLLQLAAVPRLRRVVRLYAEEE